MPIRELSNETYRVRLIITVVALSVAIVLPARAYTWRNPPSAQNQPKSSETVGIVIQIDLKMADTPQGAQLIHAYAADSRRDDGALSVEVLQQDDMPNHFTIVEMWGDEKAYQAH